MASSIIVAPAGVQSTNGWTRLSNGLLIQWGTVTASTSDGLNFSGSASFPISFITLFMITIGGINSTNSLDGRLVGQILTSSESLSGFIFAARNNINNTGVGSFTTRYVAIGN